MGFKYNDQRYQIWRNKVFRRDNFQCQLCGIKGGALNAHHIKKKSEYPHLAYITTNGITLCTKCHAAVTKNEQIFERFFEAIIKKILSYDLVYQFFFWLTTVRPDIVNAFKQYNKWEKIPAHLVTEITKNARISKHNKRRVGSTPRTRTIRKRPKKRDA